MKYVKHKHYGHGVQWDDDSVSYYKSKKIALAEIGREAGRRGLGMKKNETHKILAKFKDTDKLFEELGKRKYH